MSSENLERINMKQKIDNFESNVYFKMFKLLLPILAIFGLIFAVYDNYQSNLQSNTANERSKDILERISTKFIGNFPNQISAITNEIIDCRKQIVIAVDHPAYGCFSSPVNYEAYRHAIEDKLINANFPGFESMLMVVYDEEIRKKELIKQFGIDGTRLHDEVYFSDYLEDQNQERNENYAQNKWLGKLNSFKGGKDIPKVIKTWHQLFYEIEVLNKEFIKMVDEDPKGEVLEIGIDDEPLPVYFWLFEENKYALVSFHSYGKLTREVTISTSHPPLLEYINGIKNDIEAIKK